MTSRRALLTFWALACAAVGVVVGVVVFGLAKDDAVVCRDELVVIPEPEGWRAWPVVPDLGGYEITGERAGCVGHGLLCGLENTELRSASICPRAGVSLDAWFNGSIYQSTNDIALHGSDGAFVAVGRGGMNREGHAVPAGEAQFVVAFRPRTTAPHFAFRHLRVAYACVVLAGAFLRLLAGAFAAQRLLRRAAAYRDGARYKAAERDEQGTIAFRDGSPPLAAPGPPGPVLVRVTGVSAGTYRVAQKTTAAEVVEGDLDALSSDLTARATRALRRACLTAFAIVIVLWIAAAVVSFFDALGNVS